MPSDAAPCYPETSDSLPIFARWEGQPSFHIPIHVEERMELLLGEAALRSLGLYVDSGTTK